MLTDGKPGDEQPCLGVAEAVADHVEKRRVIPRRPWVWLAPWGPLDPRDAPDRFGSPIAPTGEGWPDLVVAAGRRVVPHLRRIRAASGGRTITVFLRDARAGSGFADIIWVPEHDRLRGPNVIVTPTSPHRINPVRLAAARAAPPLVPASVTGPRVAVLFGGDTRHARFTEEDIDRLAAGLARLRAEGAVLLATASRRTPERLKLAVRAICHYLWDGTGDNPYISLLAQAEALVVTADSTNMVGEAVATGRPVMVFEPSGGRRKTRAFLDRLTALGAIRPFSGRLERYCYTPIDSTPEVAGAIEALAATRHILRREAERDGPIVARVTNGRMR
ncbi:mitochondrial fission ELM1 family protein [Methylopila turkensis]|uniref:mitochondrial fission ELM1 family protein n=1 Tax=Methylopila turkensis TaxID=1437816 RepID=UPI0022F30FBB|nr:mitochondrial fission ELM1 family protein [Methylopila turkensis]